MNILCYPNLMRAAARRSCAIYDEALAPLGINVAQLSLMRAIQRTQPVSFTDLGSITELERSTVGRNVRVLVRMGFVDTQRCDNDQRETAAALTRQGLHILDLAAPIWDSCQQDIEQRLGADNAHLLRNLLNAV